MKPTDSLGQTRYEIREAIGARPNGARLRPDELQQVLAALKAGLLEAER